MHDEATTYALLVLGRVSGVAVDPRESGSLVLREFISVPHSRDAGASHMLTGDIPIVYYLGCRVLLSTRHLIKQNLHFEFL